MPSRSCVYVITDEHKVAANGVFEAMGLGPDNIAMPAAATAEGRPATHWYGHTWADEETANAWLAFAEGTLPPVMGPWETPTEAEALAASAAFTISVSAGEAVPTDHLTGILAGMGLVPVA